jgi:hypothetical protein
VLVLNELYFWTLSIVWCLKKLRNKNIYTKNHNTHVQNSHKCQLLTTEPITWVHTHIKLEASQTPWFACDICVSKVLIGVKCAVAGSFVATGV